MATQSSGAKRPMSYNLHRAPGRATESVSANLPSPQAPGSSEVAQRRQAPMTANRLLSPTIDWSLVGTRSALLLALAALVAWWSVRAMRTYQRSL